MPDCALALMGAFSGQAVCEIGGTPSLLGGGEVGWAGAVQPAEPSPIPFSRFVRLHCSALESPQSPRFARLPLCFEEALLVLDVQGE